ncbi:pentatricopeptide repeat-containing protein At1g08070, chloroplastic-like [Neltuma alba]|uniref:pentatricopeptide repeat-containing protein At1g08070, chloroplastic-like n=1 Tax=Neltuma alba TaxID=207710 RepID=UPI0010A55535|nr:pentatricopeptide repeat-containing protein At1g08070, chloroplastic-like [Prosopis alba]XP_028798463.1 pentatricopeptide repeat-containing protein At1g08070, chloroplastic-like [Prosopis alba]
MSGKSVSSRSIPARITQFPYYESLFFLLERCKGKRQLNQIHALSIISGLIRKPSIASKLVASSALSPLPGTTPIARAIADRIQGLDTYTWNTIARGYLEANKPEEAFSVYSLVRRRALRVDSYTVLFAIKACEINIIQGEQLHAQVYKLGFSHELIIRTAIMQIYASYDRISHAEQMFDEMPQRDLVMWNSLIALYAQKRFPLKALQGLRSMVINSIRPNEVTAASVLSSCSSMKALKEGRAVHCYVIRKLRHCDIFLNNALIGMYSNCGDLSKALLIFQLMPSRNVVSWTSMIKGYVDNNCPHDALNLFTKMESENMRPDEVIVLELISMCSKLGRFELGRHIEAYLEKNIINKENHSIANALMDMHAKCGNMKKACQIFDGMMRKTLVSWTTIINGLARHGHGMLALVRFCQMQREGFKPDGVIFLSILSACSHAGLVDEGLKCFESMINDYHIEPWMEHYGSIVDLLCRAGLVKEALDFAEAMPLKPDTVVWRMLLGACQRQSNIELTHRVAKILHEAAPKSIEDYVLLSNFHAAMEGWGLTQELRGEMKIMGLKKQDSGSSLVEIDHAL